MAGLDLPLVAIREQIASALSLIIHTSRLSDGTRRVTHITDVDGMEGETIQLNDIFTFDFDAGMDKSGRFIGKLQPTGLRPSFDRRLRNLGFDLPHELFGTFDD